MQELSLTAPQHPKNATRAINTPRTIGKIDAVPISSPWLLILYLTAIPIKMAAATWKKIICIEFN